MTRATPGPIDTAEVTHMPTGLEGFADEAKAQAKFFTGRGVSVYAQLLSRLEELVSEGETLVRGALDAAWRERSFHAAYERPLLVLAALRHDAMATPHHPLAAALGDASTGEAIVSADDVLASFATNAGARVALATRFVQTNEVTRAIAWRLPLVRFAESRRVHLVDLGCSAGLNLVADRVDVGWTRDDGEAIAVPFTGAVVARHGLDRAPVDPANGRERAWLRACLWPGQHERRRRLDAALEQATSAIASGEMKLHACEASAMPAFLDDLARAHPGDSVLAYQTVMSAYLEPDEQRRYLDAMSAWARGGSAARGERLWVELEGAPRASATGPAELRAHGKEGTVVLGHGEWHPSTLRLDRRAEEDLRRL